MGNCETVDQVEETKTFEKELEELINVHSIENESDTPDFILAQYLRGCLDVFTVATKRREEHYNASDEREIRTITIDEFRNLPGRTPESLSATKFRISEEGHKKLCENLAVGDRVFFFVMEDKQEKVEGVPTIVLELAQARVVE